MFPHVTCFCNGSPVPHVCASYAGKLVTTANVRLSQRNGVPTWIVGRPEEMQSGERRSSRQLIAGWTVNEVPNVVTMETTDSSVYIRLIPNENQRRMSDTDMDRPLFENLETDDILEYPRRRHACTGRFLTMHKRRRKKLTTRGLAQDTAILDDVLHGQVQCILNQASNWRFNAFTLETVTGGRSLPVLCVHLFHFYGLLDHFHLDVVRLWKLFSLIEEGYHSTNPYHNSIHATDVTQAMHCFIQESNIQKHLQPIEVLASLLAAVTHDLDHPGVNQTFLVNTSNHLANLYKNESVLENHHWRSAVGCLLESGVAEQIHDIRPQLEEQIKSLILATDISLQQKFLCEFRDLLDNATLDMRKAEHRQFILQIALKCADISNPCRPWEISKKWSLKVCEEFFRQGDFERKLNMTISMNCDRFTNSVPTIQVGFFDKVVTPLFVEWHRFLDSPLSRRMMRYLQFNRVQWVSKGTAEPAVLATRTEQSVAEVLSDVADENDEETEERDVVDYLDEDDRRIELSDSSEVLLPDKLPRRSSLQIPSIVTSRFDRRHSVPVNQPPKLILPNRENASRDAIHEDMMETRYDNDSYSLLSSDESDSYRRKSSENSVPDRERPLSAETLVPDLSIATMSVCADRLSMVMHGNSLGGMASATATCNTSNKLIRQQTFPPIQPYVRARYLSAATEMGTCNETLMEQRSSGSSESPSETDLRGVLVARKESVKREPDAYQSENRAKMAKLCIDMAGCSGGGQKENMDPSALRKALNRRRGSAPVVIALPPKATAANTEEAIFKTCDRFSRRGSMPADVIKIVFGDATDRSSAAVMKVPTTTSENLVYTTNFQSVQRRGSVPCDSLSVLSRNGCNGKNRSSRKKLLRRRSSGGAEILVPIIGEASAGHDLPGCSEPTPTAATSLTSWLRLKRDNTRNRPDQDALLSRRRGSLPVEMLSVSHSGSLRH